MDSMPLEAFIFMKVGDHAGENFASILQRKNHERDSANRIFWGYGGAACHPLMQVQPFSRLYTKKQGHIYLLMEPIDSKANPEVEPAKEYSDDGVNWHRIPRGITVTGSRYAFVLDKIEQTELEVNFANYAVGVGRSRGRNATDYLQGRVDKACLALAPKSLPSDSPLKKLIKFYARLSEPYAVLLR